MIDVPVVLHWQISIVQAVQRKPLEVVKLQNIVKVVDSSVNMRRSVRTVQKTVEGAQVHQYDEFVDVPVAVHVETERVPSHPVFAPQGASDTRGTDNCGSSLQE